LRAVGGDHELEDYLVRRAARRRIILVGLVVAFILVVAVPWTLMHLGVMKRDTFEIFCFADIVIFIGLVRAAVTHFKDSAY
jgi:hypothetical protein